MNRVLKDAREPAARAPCHIDGHTEEIKFEGRPMRESYLAQADAVIAVIGWKEPVAE